jgi:competence protein ComEC
VGLLGCVVLIALERVRLPGILRALLVVSFLLGFGHLVGLRPSVVRAAMALVVIVAGRLIGRRGEPLNALALTAAGLVMSAPARIFDPGLQLTFAATAGILVCATARADDRRHARWVESGVTVSASAYLATAPATAWHFGWLAPICVISNLAALPLCAFILASGYLAILGADLPVAGELICGGVRFATGLLLSLAGVAADVERGGFAVARPHPAMPVLYYALGLAWIFARARLRRREVHRSIALGLALCALALHVGPPPSPAPGVLEAAVIDVGQAQSAVVRGRRGRTVLVDAAGSTSARFDPGERIVLPFLLASCGRRIDSMILSHDHLDHVGGAAALVREIEVGEVCLPPGFHRSHPMSRLAAAARGRGAAIRLCERGVRFEVGTIRVRVVSPRRTDLALGSNDRSVAVVLGRAPYRVLIPGDLQLEGEALLVSSPLPLRAEALVLSHHGSLSGSSSSFLSRVRPRHAIVSCGAGNRFGHPHPAVCRRVRRARATLWRTDLDGMVRLWAWGGEWQLFSNRR